MTAHGRVGAASSSMCYMLYITVQYIKKMLNIYNCEAQIRFLLIVHPSPAKPNRPSWTEFTIETGFFSLILTPWSQLWIVIFSFSYTVDFRVNL